MHEGRRLLWFTAGRLTAKVHKAASEEIAGGGQGWSPAAARNAVSLNFRASQKGLFFIAGTIVVFDSPWHIFTVIITLRPWLWRLIRCPPWRETMVNYKWIYLVHSKHENGELRLCRILWALRRSNLTSHDLNLSSTGRALIMSWTTLC